MPFAVLAGLSGLVWGVGDFAGGKATQRADALPVVWLSKLVSLPLLGGFLLLTWTPCTVAGLAFGVLAGVVGTLGTVLFYRALASGSMTVVAPVTSVTSAVIPVAVGLACGERPAPPALGGVLCALLAVALVSLAPGRRGAGQGFRTGSSRLVGMAAAAGVGFGSFMVFLARASRAGEGKDGLWPVLGSHCTGLLLGGAILVATSRTTRRSGPATHRWPTGRARRWTLLAGPLDTSATATYLVATRYGDLSLVAPIAALYPLSTVLLALVVDRERPRPPQLAGLLLALAALQLVARPAG